VRCFSVSIGLCRIHFLLPERKAGSLQPSRHAGCLYLHTAGVTSSKLVLPTRNTQTNQRLARLHRGPFLFGVEKVWKNDFSRIFRFRRGWLLTLPADSRSNDISMPDRKYQRPRSRFPKLRVAGSIPAANRESFSRTKKQVNQNGLPFSSP